MNSIRLITKLRILGKEPPRLHVFYAPGERDFVLGDSTFDAVIVRRTWFGDGDDHGSLGKGFKDLYQRQARFDWGRCYAQLNHHT